MDNNNNSISEYEIFNGVFDFDFQHEFLSQGIEENTTNNEIDFDSPLVSNANALDVMKHSDLDLEQHQLYQKDLTSGWVKRRRLKRGTEEYILRKQEIKLQNRISARKSTEKKKAYIRELEAKVFKLKAEVEFRKRVLQIFPNSKPAGRLCGLRRAFSMSDLYLPNTDLAGYSEEATQLGEACANKEKKFISFPNSL